MTIEPGTRLGPYLVVSRLGEGGMGEVYRGTDTRLGREVAIKVLPPATAAAPDAQARFEVGTDDGHPYLVMELLAGATLHQVLASGPLPVSTLVDQAIALADALQGLVKILDFGLAKADGDRHEETRTIEVALTGPGTTLGTLAYMSPEQLRGEAVDARSDLFSLGLVLYEMATGRRAFAGKTGAEVSAAILHEEPPSPVSLRAELPEKLNDIIHRSWLRVSPDRMRA